MDENNGSLFDQSRTIWVWANKLADILLVALFWFFTSIPIITIGASSTAAYYVYLKMVRHEDGYLWKNFWKSFKQNFVQATVLWLIQAAFLVGLGFAVYYYYMQETPLTSGIMAFLMGMILVVCIVCIYLPPVLCRFSNTTFALLKTAMFLPFKAFKWTLVLVPMFFVFVFLGWYIIPFAIIAYGVYASLSAYIFAKIFKPYEDAIRAKRGESIENTEGTEETLQSDEADSDSEVSDEE